MDAPPLGRREGARRFDLASAAPRVVLVLLVVAAALHNPSQVNPDAIAYTRIARYWLDGRTDLAVNGYWGPLLSWLVAPLLAAGMGPLAAARAVMAVSAVVFHAGVLAVVAAFGLSRRARIAASWTAIGPTVVWSAAMITPDLLLAGLLGFGTSLALASDWTASRRRQVAAGLVFGLAYVAKAAALPVSVLIVAAVALLVWTTGAETRRTAARAAGVTIAVLAAAALPWIVVLSAKYGHFTFSTTGPIAHAVVGPGGVDRSYPTFTTFHVPDAGRITSWEDPTGLDYATWSPLGSAGLARHQARVVANNTAAIADYLRGLDVLGLGLAAAVFAFAVHRPWRENLRTQKWRWALPLVACNVAVFLPVFAYSERYYFANYGLLLGAALGLCESLTPSCWALALVVASFVGTAFPAAIPGWPHSVPDRPGLVATLRGRGDDHADAARDMAARLAAAGVAGPVAGDTRDSLYIAWYLDRPWHGEEDAPTPDRVLASGATVFVTRRGSPTALRLAADGRFEDLGPRVDATAASPLAAFRVRSR